MQPIYILLIVEGIICFIGAICCCCLLQRFGKFIVYIFQRSFSLILFLFCLYVCIQFIGKIQPYLTFLFTSPFTATSGDGGGSSKFFSHYMNFFYEQWIKPNLEKVITNFSEYIVPSVLLQNNNH